MVEELTKASGVTKILVADSDALVGFLPERLAPIVLASQNQFNYTHIVGMFQLYEDGLFSDSVKDDTF